ncbi:alkanesulfonate monooxygenase SsuD/methylene tetrahydromethanopterin reductase-like flavin-dependent oxidoreductase (luciferase family) [Flavobacterium sp. 2755]|uniref:LLM class flavin-dependent oxidoreductase n=1 Tax=Flavobacterium sp. 2755 TaxID=2817765 RepID=UPI002863FD5E|nr:LLM class flavin-dependent oxidoreductase [Flavobacterium sp. 2755]MDR6763870.1 alkanesulfonate monooxygenase SsuD/methylene tetrahydromethanopterin reductase-like flavin-dependent oxidoreductase (luciferase family) [Flavobacterium sp. 2755]
MNPIKLGVIDLGYREINAVNAIEEIIEYAVEAERLGFSKFWLAEHHYYHIKNHPYTTPDILISLIAGMTERIKIGSAGTCVSVHSPYTVVTNYKFLNNLFYGRISLGLSKGFPDSSAINQMLNKELKLGNSISFFKQNLNTIIDLLDNEEENLKTKSILIPPYGGLRPDLWYLSTSFSNFQEAIDLRLNYCVSIFHNFGQDINNLNIKKEEIMLLKESFYKQHNYYPEVAISLAIILKDTLEEAENQYNVSMEYVLKEAKEPFYIIPTTLDLLQERLEKYQNDFGIDEFIIYDLSSKNEEKIKNIQLIGERFNLSVEATV